MTRIRPAAWFMAAVALFLLAVAGYALLVHAFPQYSWTQIDTGVYRDGGIAARNQPAMLYALELGSAKLPFTYTPFAALLFAAGSGVSLGRRISRGEKGPWGGCWCIGFHPEGISKNSTAAGNRGEDQAIDGPDPGRE